MKRAVYMSVAMLALSAASHGAILLMPVPELTEPDVSLSSHSDASDGVSVVILPRPDVAQDTVGQPPVAIAESASPPQTASAPPAPVALEPPLQTAIIPNKTLPEPPPEPPLPEETVPPMPEEVPSALEDPPIEENTPTFLETEVDPNSSEPVSSEPVGPLVGYNDTFPHFEGAVGGCFGVTECRRVSGVGSYRSVARSLISSLESQGYGVELRDDLEDTGRNVYELMPPDGDAVQYLLVFSDRDGSAIYVMSDEIMTLNDLQALQAQSRLRHHLG